MSAVHYVKTANFSMPSLSLPLLSTWLNGNAEPAFSVQQERQRTRLAFMLSLSIHAMALATAVSLGDAPIVKPGTAKLELVWIAGETTQPAPEPLPPMPAGEQQVRTRSISAQPRRNERSHPHDVATTQAPTLSSPAEAPAAAANASTEVSPAPTHASPHDSSANSQPAVTETPRFNADYLHNPPPVYPPTSRRRGEEGRVLLKVWVMPDGRPGNIQLHGSCGFERLDSAALDAVRRWQFVPARRGSEMLGGWVIVPIDFSLKEAG